MATFVLIHGGGDVGWSWHLVVAALAARGHDAIAPDLPCDDDAAGLAEYADVVTEAVGDRADLVVVGHSYGGYTATLVAERLRPEQLVLVTAMIPTPGETTEEYFANTGWEQALEAQARRDGVPSDIDDPFHAFYHDVPRPLAQEAVQRGRDQSDTPGLLPWPLESWPPVPTRFVLCTEDRFFPPDYLRPVVADRLGVVPYEIRAGHCVALSRPDELADLLVGYLER